MSIFSHHKNGYLKNETSRYKTRQEDSTLHLQAGEHKDGSVHISKANGFEKNGIIHMPGKHKNGEVNGGRNNNNNNIAHSNGMHKNAEEEEVKEICMNGNHYSGLENGNVNGTQKNGKQNGLQKNGGSVEYGSGSSGSSSINGDVDDTFIPVCKPGRFICR
ncbi:unnamed protein product [Trichobilharzia regenti]|nr:unnamed protein product [Trichobilharzia regenti]